MRITDLQEFVRLCQTLNFTQTAKEFYISQSVLSKHIANLEAELDAKLFARTSSGVQITDSGKRFLGGAQAILNAYNQALQELQNLKRGYQETITVGYLYGAAHMILLPAIHRFNQLYPTIPVGLKACEVDEVFDLLAADEIDVGITTLFNIESKLSSQLYQTRDLYEDGLSVIVPKGHRLADAEQLSLEDLKGERLTMAAAPFMNGDAQIMESILKPVLDRIEIRHLLHDLASMQLLIRDSGTLFFSFSHISNALGGHAVAIPLKEASHLHFSVGAIWKKTKTSAVLVDLITALAIAAHAHTEKGGGF